MSAGGTLLPVMGCGHLLSLEVQGQVIGTQTILIFIICCDLVALPFLSYLDQALNLLVPHLPNACFIL
jgi:hypothetical protein